MINETDEWPFGVNTVYIIFALRVLWSVTLVGMTLIIWLEKYVLPGFLIVTFNTALLQVRVRRVLRRRLPALVCALVRNTHMHTHKHRRCKWERRVRESEREETD